MGLLELTLRRRPPHPRNSPVDGIRILALLPPQWRKELRQESGTVIVRVHLDGSATAGSVHTEMARALADPAIENWELVTSELVPGVAEQERGTR